MKAKINLKNVRNYIQGNWRAALLEYYPDGLPKHIEEQYYWRIQQVAERSPECLENKECKICSCSIPELFMADKACENKPSCYPEMMSKEQWELYSSVPEAVTNPFNKTIFDEEKVKGTTTTIPITSGPIIVRDFSIGQETLADLMQNNPNLTKEELLYWCPEFQEPLSQVAQEPHGHFIVGYDAPGIKGTQFKIKLSKEQFSGNMTPEQIEDIARDLGFVECPICKGNECTNDGFPCYKCKPEEYKEQTKDY